MTFTSLDNAYAQTPYPRENLPFIRAYTESVGIIRYTLTTGYIRADRADGAPPLCIASGWTNGFLSEAEVRRACGEEAAAWASTRSQGLWGVTHPAHGSGYAANKNTTADRDYGFCPTHFTQLPATGICSDCD